MKSQKSFEKQSMGTLYLVPTPIGNLDDITFRAIDTLKQVDKIAAEDTRHTQKLLNHFEIETPQISFHEHNTQERIPEIIATLKTGKSFAQVSDAGMPSISDPGFELVQACVESGIAVVPLPGANAAVTALIASGINPQPFYFHGFLSRKKKERKEELELLNNKRETMLFYESPHRLKDVLKDMCVIFGGNRPIVLARELTKRYEELLRGTLDEAYEWSNSEEVRGEFCLVVEGNTTSTILQTQNVQYLSYTQHVELIMEQEGLSNKEAIKEAAKRLDIPKRIVYAEYHEL